MKKAFLVCNAHLDPVWLWEWEEGAAETLSTFRTAADFCEEYDGFVFNHNEAILYKWIEEYEPSLFQRIQKLVKSGKWHITGGWHLQPDCNMPSGESIIRHILTGKNYFKERFGVEPHTAINFDSFGHSRGLVQILTKTGYDSYIVCRPQAKFYGVNDSDFLWVGYDDSEVMVHRSDENYNSVKDKAVEKLKKWLEENRNKNVGLFLWGIGDHGGGPSRKDIKDINAFIDNSETKESITHSFPEAYFSDLKSYNYSDLPRYYGSLNPVAQGCYTSQILVKQKHRKLENEIYMLEKMVSSTSIQGYMKYPKEELDSALYDLMTAEFHDALPGSAIKNVEEATIQLLDHGLEIVSRLRAKAFFALASGQEKVKDGETPILIYNPHPFKITTIMECEFVIPAQNWDISYYYPVMYQGDKVIPCQSEQELSSFDIDWRKRAVFMVELMPSQMNRFDFKFKILPEKPKPELMSKDEKITFSNGSLEVVINCATGYLDKYSVKGIDYLKENSFVPKVIEDSFNSWGGSVNYNNVIGQFKLMSKEEGSAYSGLSNKVLDSVRVVEDGDVRTVVEAVFSYKKSSMIITYMLPKLGSEMQIQVKVNWNEKDKMLKLSVPSTIEDGKYFGETIYGQEELKNNGDEVVSQRWVEITDGIRAITIINDGIYGSNFINGEAMPTLLRSASYATNIIPQDRYTERMDQGERTFNFWINCGEHKECLNNVSKEAQYHNEKPFALAYCPSGSGTKPSELIIIDDEAVQLSAFKRAEKSEGYIIRLFESTGYNKSVRIRIPYLRLEKIIELKKFEIKTLMLDPKKGIFEEVSILEE